MRFHPNDYARYFPCIVSFNPQIWLSSFHAQGRCTSEKFHEFTKAAQLTQAESHSQGMSKLKPKHFSPYYLSPYTETPETVFGKVMEKFPQKLGQFSMTTDV